MFNERLNGIKKRHSLQVAAWKEADLSINANVAKGAKRLKPPGEELDRREQRKLEMKAELEGITKADEYTNLCGKASVEKSSLFDAVFDASKAMSRKDADAWQRSLKTDGVSARLLLEEKGGCGGGQKRSRDGKPDLPRRGLVSVEKLRECLVGDDAAHIRPTGESMERLNELSPQHQNAELNAKISELCGGEVPVTIVGGDPGMRELLVLSNPDLEWHSRREREAVLGPTRPPSPSLTYGVDDAAPPPPPPLRSDGDRLPDYYAPARRQRYTLPQRRLAMAPARFYIKPKHRDDPEKQRRFHTAKAYRHAHVHTPSDVDAAQKGLIAHCSKGPTATKLLAYLHARSAALPLLLPWYTHTQRRHLRWKAFIETQRSFSRFCDRIRQMRQPGGGQIVLAYGAWALAGMAPGKGLPPCIGKGLLKKLSREFLVVAVPEHFTSKKCFKCGGSCGNHAYLAERDRRVQSDERLEQRLAERLERCETEAQRDSARQAYDRGMSRPCEIRGLRFCQGCSRCLNRDANSAPQMAVQLKRLLVGAGPLHRMSKADQAMQEMNNAIEAC